jgi:hypothetical protein
MAAKVIYQLVDDAIKHVWLQDIKRDHALHSLLMEASMQSALYHHLRNRLGEQFFSYFDIHLFCEWPYKVGDKLQKADLAFVQLNSDKVKDNHLKDSAKEVIAIIELKYKGGINAQEPFDSEIIKIQTFEKSLSGKEPYKDTFYYLGFFDESVIEKGYSLDDHDRWLKSAWAQNKLAILFANRGNKTAPEKIISGIDHTNNLNRRKYADYFCGV